MNVGLPGTGIGGLFYFFSILAMLLIEAVNFALRKKKANQWKIAKRLVPMLTGVIFSMLLLDWFLSKIINLTPISSSMSVSSTPYHVLTIAPIIYSSAVLMAVLVSVRILQLFIKPNAELIEFYED